MPAYSLESLRKDVAEGRIDTVLVAFPDMQGRLIGKRFLAEFFLEGALEETHGCNYLLADDIDMEPVPGYAAANWGKGYGDFVMKPDLATLMKCTWLEGTALVLADLVDHHDHEPIPHAPRSILKKQLARLQAMGLSANFASELEFYLFDETFRSAHEKGFQNLQAAGYYIEDYHIFQTTKEEGVGAGAGGDKRPLCRGADHGGPACGDQERHQGNRLCPGQGRHLHGQVRL
jgi:glutamine synthetase